MKYIGSKLALAGAFMVSAQTADAWAGADTNAVAVVLQSYETALNAGDTDTIVGLYTNDGVFMPQHSPSQIGSEAVRAAYNNVFTAITLSVEFDVQEITMVSAEWAFARTNSAGTVTINATGQKNAEANQELFLFRKHNGSWKIARYAFSTTNPPRP